MKNNTISRLSIIFIPIILCICYACSACSTNIEAMKEFKIAICDHSFSNNAVLMIVKSNGHVVVSKGEWLNTGDINSNNFMKIESSDTIQLSNKEIRKLNRIMKRVEQFDGEFGASVDALYLIADIDGKEYWYNYGVERDDDFHTYIETLRRYCGISGVSGLY